jgi:hypothetical protein
MPCLKNKLGPVVFDLKLGTGRKKRARKGTLLSNMRIRSTRTITTINFQARVIACPSGTLIASWRFLRALVMLVATHHKD